MKKSFDLILSGSYIAICMVDQPYIIYLLIGALYFIKAFMTLTDHGSK